MSDDQDTSPDFSAMKSTTIPHHSPPPHRSPVVRFATPQTVQRMQETYETGLRTSTSRITAGTVKGTPYRSGMEDTSQLLMNQSTTSVSYTPIMTPNRSGDVVLLSPSRTISETLKSLTEATGNQLEEIWDDIGYSAIDRASQLNDLLLQFKDLCELKIAEERGVAETFRQSIAESKQELQRLCEALKQPLDETVSDGTAHHTNLLEELESIESRLHQLRETASEARDDLKECRDFLIEAHGYLGINMDPLWRDIDSNLTSERRELFHQKREELKAELTSRSAAVVQLVRDCQHFMRDLGIDPDDENCSDIDRRIAGSLVRSKDDSFMMASKHRTETCVGISGEAIDEVTKRASELHAEKRRRKNKLADMGAEICALWVKLRVPEEEQKSFTDGVRGLGMDTLKKGENELARLNAMKTEMIGQLVFEVRQEIQELWDQIDADEEYRNSFHAFSVQNEKDFNDELLEAHESYLGELHARLEERQPILRLIERREAIVKERMEYENLQKDPERLKQRSATLARQLMEEEKMARRIKRDLPKLTSLLTEKLSEWKERHGEDFIYQSCLYMDEISRQEEEWDAYKEKKHQKKSGKRLEESVMCTNDVLMGKSKEPKQAHTRQPLGHAKLNNKTRV